MLAYCGNDCSRCPRFTATRSGDPDQLRAVAELWHRAGWRDSILSPGEIACEGCRSADRCRYGIRECAIEKGVESCGLCREYPCERVSTAFERSEAYADTCRQVCSEEEFEVLRTAFFYKKRNLDQAGR